MYFLTQNAIPKMTSYNNPSGIASASSENSTSYSAWRAFGGGNWATANNVRSGWLKYQFPSPIIISKYMINSGSVTVSFNAKDWTFEASNNDVDWTVLDTRIGETNWQNYEERTYEIENKIPFLIYRINVLNNNGGNYLYLSQLKMFELKFDYKFLLSLNNKRYSIVPDYSEAETLIPKMTSNITPSGRAFASSIYNSSYDAWRAFDQIDNNEGFASAFGSGGIGYLGYEFVKPVIVGKYGVRSMNGLSHLSKMPRDWTFEGSNDGVEWLVLDKQINQTWTAINTDKEYVINNKIPFKMYRLNWTANNGFISYTDINELTMFEYIPGTLIYLESGSESNFLNYGLDKNQTINLTSENTRINYVAQKNVLLGSGKVIKQSIDSFKTSIKKVAIE